VSERHVDVRPRTAIRYDTDSCPACASADTQPYAVIVGASELYGYLCLTCGVSWPVIQTTGAKTPKSATAAERRSG
jgi:hypothetical protein